MVFERVPNSCHASSRRKPSRSGYEPAEMEAGEELARQLAAAPRIEKHLVLTGSTQSAD